MTLSSLTRAERAVTDLLIKGYSRQEIADLHGVVLRTIESQLHRARKKLGIKSVGADIALFALYVAEARDEVARRIASCHALPLEPLEFVDEALP